ncbi:branched-subunit amino acid aminotransferase/4-amino-4-deoxychorismate lyase [Brevibacterium sanguinis]|uniref:Branched-subunit amino acid aminotransferase/4-amino-4-deoxychorismate lyase n=2 Tax=Brevibacterium TaxID=1696 RepID=A0A366INW9_9MICO|nr:MULTISPECIES: aminotransferase class IV [Brevibacterium]RBP67819.1 branched-subunit amino acid aminotransferase/4-amino-4-deoxychorismate lyase [Brevibacterium sanguinis]RBP74764.1 branched-subunit amino acid aminotransferase/4-amino-4-deoxychorismate lyase [Brevibacterium celere]
MTAWVWNAAAADFEPTEIEGPLLVADSWLVVNGRSRSLDPHRERFTRSARELGLPVPETDEFWTQLVSLVPFEGEWFPRMEFVAPTGSGDIPAFVFRVRPAPPRKREMKLWIPPFPDPRKSPRIKGPDIPLLNELRQEAVEHGCDDVLLYDVDGHVLETGTSSLLWWEGDTLCVPDPSLPLLPGTTSARMLTAARTQGLQIVHRRIRIPELSATEVWTVNALHGIRIVVQLSDDASATPASASPSRIRTWRLQLETERRAQTRSP